MKGVSLECVKLKADTDYEGDLYKLYEALYHSNIISFNLLLTAPRMKSTKDRKIKNQKSFTRRISFN